MTANKNKVPFDMAYVRFTHLKQELGGRKLSELRKEVLRQTGWTVLELERGARVRPDLAPAIEPVCHQTDVAALAKRLADHSRRGGTVVMYPLTPID